MTQRAGMAQETNQQTRRFRLGYRPELDGLRGIAILGVMLYHLGVQLGGHRLASAGYFGVDIFFVLSGFLITTILVEEWQREGGISLPNFYQRRFLRLLPALTLLSLVMIGFALELALRNPMQRSQSDDVLRSVLATQTYTANFVDMFDLFRNGLGGLGIAWSLAQEEQFYLIWPAVLLLLLRRGSPRRALGLVLFLIAGVTLLRALRIHDGATWYRVYFGPDTRADSLLIGCALGLIATANLLPRAGWAHRLLRAGFWLGLLSLGLLVTRGPKGPDYLGRLQYVVYSGAALATAAVIAGILVGSPLLAGSALRSRPLTWVGRLSYGFYLWHLPIAVYLHPTWVPPDWLLPLHVAVTVAVVSASYYLVERRYLRLKSKLRAARATPRPIPRELALVPVPVSTRRVERD